MKNVFTGTKHCRHFFDKSVHVTMYVLELFKPADERIDGFAKVLMWEFHKYVVDYYISVGTNDQANCGNIYLILSYPPHRYNQKVVR